MRPLLQTRLLRLNQTTILDFAERDGKIFVFVWDRNEWYILNRMNGLILHMNNNMWIKYILKKVIWII